MHRISLGNTLFEGENDAYLVSGNETVLVDTAVASADARERLERGLRRRNVDLGDVDRIFLTHYHADHSGLAGEIQRESDAAVHVHAADAPLVEGDEGAWSAYRDRLERHFETWGMPPEKRDELRSYMEGSFDIYGEPVDVDPIEDGETFALGEIELRVLHTPGHTLGSCTFVATDRNEAFTGDTLLPVYTPNVGGADVRVDRPLERYLESLRRVHDRRLDRAWPGHRDPIADPGGRIRTIVDHHEERARRVLDVLESLREADAWTVGAELFGELADIHVLHGPGEAHAHLDHLERLGAVERAGTTYRPAEGARERLDGGAMSARTILRDAGRSSTDGNDDK